MLIFYKHACLLDAPMEELYWPPGLCHIPASTAVLGAAGISGASSLAGGKKASNAAQQASAQQVAAEEQALALQQQIYSSNKAELQPFIDTAQGYAGPGGVYQAYVNQILNTPYMTWSPTQAQLESTPGYQFTLSQGMRAAQNQLTATGTGSGGPSVRQAITTAEDIAGTTYNQQFQNWLAQQGLTMQQQNQQLGAAYGPVQTGLQAAGALAGVGVQTGSQIGQTLGSIGASQAAGTVGSANALVGGLSGVGNAATGAATNLAMLNAFGGQGSALFPNSFGNVTVGGGGDVGTPEFNQAAAA